MTVWKGEVRSKTGRGLGVWGGWRKVEAGQDLFPGSPGGPGPSWAAQAPMSLCPVHPGWTGSLQPHHHFVPANEVGRLAEQLHIRHRHRTRLLPDQHGVVQLHIAPSYGWDQVLALGGQEAQFPPQSQSHGYWLAPCPPTRSFQTVAELWRGHLPYISPPHKKSWYMYCPPASSVGNQ